MQQFVNVLKVVDFLLSQVLSVVLFRVGIGKAIFGSYYWRLDLSPDYITHLIGDEVHALIKLVK